MILIVVRCFSIFWILCYYSLFVSATTVVLLASEAEDEAEHPQLRHRHLQRRRPRINLGPSLGLFEGDWILFLVIGIITLFCSVAQFCVKEKKEEAKIKLKKTNEIVDGMEEAMFDWIQNDIIMQEENINPTREMKKREVQEFRFVAKRVKQFAERSCQLSGMTGMPDHRDNFICSMDEEVREMYQVFRDFVQDCLQQRGNDDDDDDNGRLLELLESITTIFNALHRRNERRFAALKKGRVVRSRPLATRESIKQEASHELTDDNVLRSEKLAEILSMTHQMDEADVKSEQVAGASGPLITAVVTKDSQDQDCGLRVSQQSAKKPIKICFVNRKKDGMFAQSDLKIGMEIVSINNVSMQYKTAKEFTRMLEETVGTVTIVAQTVLPKKKKTKT